jgi:hypothetical protein
MTRSPDQHSAPHHDPAPHPGPALPQDPAVSQVPVSPLALDRHPDPPRPLPSADTDRPSPSLSRDPYGALPGEAEVVDQMIELRAGGLGYQRIAFELNRRGLSTRQGRNWHPATVRWALKRYRPDLCPPRTETLPVPQHLAVQHYRDRDRQRRHRARSEVAA